MRFVTVLVLAGLAVLALYGAPALASDAVGVREATRHERAAYRALVRARAEYRTSCYVTRWTRTFTAQYGAKVGRWTWLASDVGWPRGTWQQLMYIIDRESGGDPSVYNYEGSGCAGLLQLAPCHYSGRFDPTDPRANLKYGLKLYRGSGWAPWSL